MDIVHRRAVQALRALARDEALGLACTRCDSRESEWVRRAFHKGELLDKCLGVFSLHNPERPDLPWPAVVFLVRHARGPDQAMLSLYLGPDEVWTVVDEYPLEVEGGERRMPIDWSRYAGDPKGPPGVVNGDDAGLPAGAPPTVVPPEVRRTGPASVPVAAPPGTPRPPSSPRSRGGVARPSRGRNGGSRRGSPSAKPAAAAAAAPPASPATRPSRLELLVQLLRLLDG